MKNSRPPRAHNAPIKPAPKELTADEKAKLAKDRLAQIDREDEAASQLEPKQELGKDEARTVRQFVAAFSARLPNGAAQQGAIVADDNDPRLAGEFAVPDGRYRVVGSDWIVVFRKHRFAGAELARPPLFGGKNVIPVL